MYDTGILRYTHATDINVQVIKTAVKNISDYESGMSSTFEILDYTSPLSRNIIPLRIKRSFTARKPLVVGQWLYRSSCETVGGKPKHCFQFL